MEQSNSAGDPRGEREKYTPVLRQFCDAILEVDLDKGRYEYAVFDENMERYASYNGDYVSTYIDYMKNKVEESDTFAFHDVFNLDSLKEAAAAGKERVGCQYRIKGDDGYSWEESQALLVPKADGGASAIIVVRNVDNLKRSGEIADQNRVLIKQQMDSERYHIIVNRTDTLVFDWWLDTNERYVSTKLKERFPMDYERENLFDELREKALHPDDVEEFGELYRLVTQEHMDTDEVVRLLDNSGEYVWCKMTATTTFFENGVPRRIIVTVNDVDEAERHKLELQRRAEYDALTGLYNMQTFYEKSEAMVRAHPNKGYVVLRMDVSRFKLVNDLYGLDEGDRLLQHIAKGIRETLADREAVYGRLNSDIFVICAAYARPDEVIALMRRLIAGVEQYSIMGYKASPSFGVCFVEDSNLPMSILCDRAGMAQKTIKGNMITRWAFYGDKLREQQIDERMIENCMEEALEKGEFLLYLQPKHDVASGRIVGAEALARWMHPTEGLMMPNRFIPLFERNGFIIKLDEYVWEQVCQLLRKWIDEGRQPVPVSMNVSRVHMFNYGFEDRLIKMIHKYGLPESLLELELTESTLVENEKELHQMMIALQGKGLNISMDDFGAGYSSLNMLRNVPVQTIKLDKEFLNETAANAKGKIIIEHTISMVNNLDLNVVAEGVETAEQAEFLENAGCGTAQGYFYSKPMPVVEFEQRLFGETAESGEK